MALGAQLKQVVGCAGGFAWLPLQTRSPNREPTYLESLEYYDVSTAGRIR